LCFGCVLVVFWLCFGCVLVVFWLCFGYVLIMFLPSRTAAGPGKGSWACLR
jgi:hypothetical protein